MQQAGVTPDICPAVAASLEKAEATGKPAGAMVLPDSSVVTGRTSPLLGASAFLLAAVVRLAVFTDNLPYRVLGAQPIVATEKRGWFTKLGEALDEFGERLHGTFGRKES